MVDVFWWISVSFSTVYYSLWLAIFTLFLSYLIPILWARFRFEPRNLRTYYGAEWALVSGGSQGIGFALVKKLAAMGLNVVIVARDDAALPEAMRFLERNYTTQRFLAVPVDLGTRRADDTDYLRQIEEATKDICVQLVFNNAGYLVLKGFVKADLEPQLSNLECNVVSHIRVTHLFLRRMIAAKKRGLVTFTSSQAAFFPAPSSALYGSGKAMLSSFAASLAIEMREYGIDVCSLQAGPMATNFYDNQPKLQALDFFKRQASTPDDVAEVLLRSAGRLVWRDQSLFTAATRLLVRIVDMNLLVEIIARGQTLSSDFKNHPDLH